MSNMWETMARASAYYDKLGYRYIEAPWIVDPKFANLTGPTQRTYQLYPIAKEGVLVASGEQSFIQLLDQGSLRDGKFFTVTPCFRDDELDKFHQRYFLKLELFATPGDLATLLEMVVDAKNFFIKEQTGIKPTIRSMPQERPTDIVGSNFDIVTQSGIELGSYGVRDIPEVGSWCFGTGVAEPRYSRALMEELSR